MTNKAQHAKEYINFLDDFNAKIAQMTACIYAQNINKYQGLNISYISGSYVSYFKNEAGDNVEALFTYEGGNIAKYSIIYKNPTNSNFLQPSKNLNSCLQTLDELNYNAYYSDQKSSFVSTFITEILNQQAEFFAQLWQRDFNYAKFYRLNLSTSSGTEIQVANYIAEKLDTEIESKISVRADYLSLEELFEYLPIGTNQNDTNIDNY